jgi:hypothetical protein
MENVFDNLDKESLLGILDDWAKNWLAHDGLWFQAVEHAFGMDAAIEADREAWKNFTQIEARRIMERHGIEKGGGIPALVQALQLRMYARLNIQEINEITDTRCVLRMINCRVQNARKSKNLEDFPCKQVGIEEYTYFAKVIDERIETRCITCPPDDHTDEYWCAWEFTLP